MPTLYELTTFWGARVRTVSEYAGDIHKLLKTWHIRNKRPETSWYGEDTRTDSEVLLKDHRSIEAILRVGHQRWVHGAQPFDAFQLVFSNGLPGLKHLKGSVLCGITQESKGMWFPNRVTLAFWGGAGTSEIAPEAVDELLEMAVKLFDPDWGGVGVKGRPQVPLIRILTGYPIVGWKVYFSNRYGVPPDGAVPLTNGFLFSAVDKWFDQNNQDHLRRREELEVLLDHHGWLRPSAAPLGDSE